MRAALVTLPLVLTLLLAAPAFGTPTWAELRKEITGIERRYPKLVRIHSLGRSLEGRDIPLIKVSDRVKLDEDEPELLLVAGMHPREQQPVACLMALLRDLTSDYARNPKIRALVDSHEVWIVPVLNVDGKVHDFARGTTSKKRRNWRKNRRLNGDGTRGVDLNRNFPVHWVRTSSKGGGEDFPGTGPASEPETRALMAFIAARPLRAFADLHSYMGSLIAPRFLAADDAKRYGLLLSGMAAAQSRPYDFRKPIAGELPPPVVHRRGGLSFVWAASTQGITSLNLEVAGKSFYDGAGAIEAEYRANVRGALLHLIGASGGLPLRREGSAVFVGASTSRVAAPGAQVEWKPSVTGSCEYGVLLSESSSLRVLSEIRAAPFSTGFTVTIMGRALPGSRLPLRLYLWDAKRGRSVVHTSLLVR